MKITGQKARDFIQDVSSGVSDSVLKEKYGLTDKLLVLQKWNAREILAKRKAAASMKPKQIRASEAIRDIRAGVENEALMEKYGISQRQLQILFRKIIEAGLMNVMELARRLSVTESQVTEAFGTLHEGSFKLD